MAYCFKSNIQSWLGFKVLHNVHCSVLLQLLYTVALSRSYIESDCYVGLYRSATQCTCRGRDVRVAVCDACRASWRWYDGSPMDMMNWEDEEPNELSCGRITSEGWAENNCAEELRYICERGLYIYTSILSVLRMSCS